MTRWVAVGALALVLVLSAGAGGYALGRSSGEDLDAARAAGERAGQAEGAALGEERGTKEGLRAGRKQGYKEAYAKAQREAPDTEPTAPAPQSGAAETQESEPELEPCLYGPEALCTPEENELESSAERLCGPGTAAGRREAAEQGIEC